MIYSIVSHMASAQAETARQNLSLELRRGALVLAVLAALDTEQYGYSLKTTLADKGVEIRGDERARELYMAAKAATPEDWSTEYLAFTVCVKVVDSLEDAIDHINEFGSHHTDGILATDTSAIDTFVAAIDSASVMVNASTRFADGGEYGLGAEIGISTDKLHARGPMGAADLTTYKWIVTGSGHIR